MGDWREKRQTNHCKIREDAKDKKRGRKRRGMVREEEAESGMIFKDEKKLHRAL